MEGGGGPQGGGAQSAIGSVDVAGDQVFGQALFFAAQVGDELCLKFWSGAFRFGDEPAGSGHIADAGGRLEGSGAVISPRVVEGGDDHIEGVHAELLGEDIKGAEGGGIVRAGRSRFDHQGGQRLALRQVVVFGQGFGIEQQGAGGFAGFVSEVGLFGGGQDGFFRCRVAEGCQSAQCLAADGGVARSRFAAQKCFCAWGCGSGDALEYDGFEGVACFGVRIEQRFCSGWFVDGDECLDGVVGQVGMV